MRNDPPRSGMGSYQKIYETVRQIPLGAVATYGDVAREAGLPGHARMVGYALSAVEAEDVPWHRVINARGQISLTKGPAEEQRERLEAEGVTFDDRGRIDLSRFRWRPHRV